MSWIDIVKGERYGDDGAFHADIRVKIKYLDEKIKLHEQLIVLMKEKLDIYREMSRKG